MGKILLVWENIPDKTEMYEIDADSDLADLAIRSAGLYINADDIQEGDAIEQLNERLPGLKPMSSARPAIGPFEKVVVCGFIS